MLCDIGWDVAQSLEIMIEKQNDVNYEVHVHDSAI